LVLSLPQILHCKLEACFGLLRSGVEGLAEFLDSQVKVFLVPAVKGTERTDLNPNFSQT
jgi:hypothetical protein